MRSAILLLLLSAIPFRMDACSCFGPSTLCETLAPPYEPPMDPSWWIPDHIVLAVKLATVEYGVDLQVIHDFRGVLQADQFIRVWGDCGFLCRMYNTSVADGDTVLWGIKPCDLWGNEACGGTSFEQSTDFQLPVCGIYWLGYSNGLVSGPLFTEGATETVSLAAFDDLVNGCLPTTVRQRTETAARAWLDGAGISIETGAEWSDEKHACVTDASGRVLLDVGYRGSKGRIPLPTTTGGLLLVRVGDGRRAYVAKLYAD